MTHADIRWCIYVARPTTDNLAKWYLATLARTTTAEEAANNDEK